MKLATWNINSVRLRINLVLDFLKDADIDVLCLQETKTEDAHFPAGALAEAGWAHHAYRGEKSYNGVAIISRLPLADPAHMDWVGRSDCRHISAQVDGGPLVHNFYVPAGGDVPDREENPKFGHKLDFIAEMTSPFTRMEASRSRDTGGAGLGLAIARALLDQLEGGLSLSNRDGGGFSARVTLPTSANGASSKDA